MRQTAQKLGAVVAVGAAFVAVVVASRRAGRSPGDANAPEITVDPPRSAKSPVRPRERSSAPPSAVASTAAANAAPAASASGDAPPRVTSPLDRRAEWELDAKGCSAHQFGEAIALGDDALLVGAPRRDYAVDRGGGTPAACLYRREAGAWSLVQKVLAEDPPLAEGFARAVALGPTFAVIGAAGHENGDGPTHDYARGPAPDGKLLPRARLAEPSGAPEVFAEYGAAVASDARFAFVGAHLESPKGCDGCGAVFVFDRAAPAASATPAVLRGATPHEAYGSAVAVSGELLVVGASGAYSSGKLTGAAYVLRRDGASYREICRLPGATPGEEYGGSVAVDGARVVVAGNGASAGHLTLHEVKGDTCTLTDSFATPLGAVAVRGDWIAGGEPMFDGGAPASGRVALLHVRADGRLELRAWLLPTRVRAHAFFGASVALGAAEVLAGAPGIDADGSGFVAGARL